MYVYIYRLDGEFGKISPNDFKNTVKCLYTMYVDGDFGISVGGWIEIIEISITSCLTIHPFIMIKHVLEMLSKITS